MKEKDEFDKVFKKAFDDFQPAVPADSWTAVKGGIRNIQLEKATRLKNRYRNLSALLSLLLVGTIASFMYFNDGEKDSSKSNELAKSHSFRPENRTFVNPDTIVRYITKVKTDTVYLTRFMPKANLVSDDLTKALENPKIRKEIVSYLIENYEFTLDESPEQLIEEPLQTVKAPIKWPLLSSLNILQYDLLDIDKPGTLITGVEIRSEKKKKRELKERIPLKDRIFYQAMAEIESGKLVVKNASPDFGNDEGFGAGLYAGLRLSPKLWLKTGVNIDRTEYKLSPNGRVELNSELINGAYQYVYRSPLGNLVIPGNELNNPATATSTIDIESHNDNIEYRVNIPFQLNYDYLSKDVKFLGYYRPLSAYVGLNSYIQKPLKNSVTTEIYESDGSEFDLTLDEFNSISNLSVGAGLQTGLKLEIYPRWKLLSELGYNRNLTYRVNNEYFQSFNRGLYFSAGLEIHFK